MELRGCYVGASEHTGEGDARIIRRPDRQVRRGGGGIVAVDEIEFAVVLNTLQQGVFPDLADLVPADLGDLVPAVNRLEARDASGQNAEGRGSAILL